MVECPLRAAHHRFRLLTFYGIAAWVYDMGDDRRRQLGVVGTLATIVVALGVGLALANWL